MRSPAGGCCARAHPSRPGTRITRPAWPSSSRSWYPFRFPSSRDGRLPCGGPSRCWSGCCGGSPALGGGSRTRPTSPRPPGPAVRPGPRRHGGRAGQPSFPADNWDTFIREVTNAPCTKHGRHRRGQAETRCRHERAGRGGVQRA